VKLFSAAVWKGGLKPVPLRRKGGRGGEEVPYPKPLVFSAARKEIGGIPLPKQRLIFARPFKGGGKRRGLNPAI